MADKKQQQKSKPWEIFGDRKTERRDRLQEADREYQQSVKEGRWPKEGRR